MDEIHLTEGKPLPRITNELLLRSRPPSPAHQVLLIGGHSDGQRVMCPIDRRTIETVVQNDTPIQPPEYLANIEYQIEYYTVHFLQGEKKLHVMACPENMDVDRMLERLMERYPKHEEEKDA